MMKYTTQYRRNNAEKINRKERETRVINGDLIREKDREKYAKRRDRIAECRAKKRKENKVKNNETYINKKVYDAKHHKKQIRELADGYIISCYTQASTLESGDISPDLIELKRLIINIKRRIKHEKNS